MDRDQLNKKYLEKLENIKYHKWGKEIDHIKADDLLCELLKELGYIRLVEVFKSIDKWYV